MYPTQPMYQARNEVRSSDVPTLVVGSSVMVSQGGTSSLDAKFGARFSQFHQIRGKIWEVLLPQEGKESQFGGHLGLYLKFKGQNLGYLSPIFLEAKFGAPAGISEPKFGAKLPDLLIRKYPLGMVSA